MATSSTRVSVIIPTYNRAHMLREAIDSVLNQTFGDFEIIIIDGFSTDDTEAVVNSYHDRRIKYFKNRNNGLASINRNFGIEKSRGEYIAFLDDDDLWMPQKLEKQVRLLDSDKDLGLVYSDCFIVKTSGKIRKKTCLEGKKVTRGATFIQLLGYNFINTPTVVIRKEALKKAGLFNPSQRICEDYDLWLRIAKLYPFGYVDEPLTKCRVNRKSVIYNKLPLALKEDLKIKDYWLKKNPELNKKFSNRVNIIQYMMCLKGVVVHILRHRNFESIKESASLIFYMLSRVFS